jgi:hypothetical protein
MSRVEPLLLSAAQRDELAHLRDRHPKPYLRERAAALLKVADGWPLAQVARLGLLAPRDPETVAAWLGRYRAAGAAGLAIRPGRGRKPAFFSLRAQRRPGRRPGP